MTEFVDKRNELLTEKELIDGEVQTIELDLVKYRDMILEIERKLRGVQQKISAETEKMHSVQNAISIASERIKSQERNSEKYTEEVAEYEIQLENTQFAIDDNMQLLANLEEIILLKEKEIEDFKQIVAEKKVNLMFINQAQKMNQQS
jgi:chromosome segregation ATPase